jgi:hypothetical protein
VLDSLGQLQSVTALSGIVTGDGTFQLGNFLIHWGFNTIGGASTIPFPRHYNVIPCVVATTHNVGPTTSYITGVGTTSFNVASSGYPTSVTWAAFGQSSN